MVTLLPLRRLITTKSDIVQNTFAVGSLLPMPCFKTEDVCYAEYRRLVHACFMCSTAYHLNTRLVYLLMFWFHILLKTLLYSADWIIFWGCGFF